MTLVKRVHFASQDIFYDPEPLTPSSFNSTGSLPETPRIPLRRSKPSKILKSKSNNDVQIHHLLSLSSNPPLTYDLSIPLAYPPPPLHQPASFPSLQSVSIICPQFLPWSISIAPSESSNHITITDVLIAIYRTLRLAVHPLEYASLSESEQTTVAIAYEKRCRLASVALGDPHDSTEAKKGVKRVDFLGGRNRFMGLVRVPRTGLDVGMEVWELVVS